MCAQTRSPEMHSAGALVGPTSMRLTEAPAPPYYRCDQVNGCHPLPGMAELEALVEDIT